MLRNSYFKTWALATTCAPFYTTILDQNGVNNFRVELHIPVRNIPQVVDAMGNAKYVDSQHIVLSKGRPIAWMDVLSERHDDDDDLTTLRFIYIGDYSELAGKHYLFKGWKQIAPGQFRHEDGSALTDWALVDRAHQKPYAARRMHGYRTGLHQKQYMAYLRHERMLSGKALLEFMYGDDNDDDGIDDHVWQ